MKKRAAPAAPFVEKVIERAKRVRLKGKMTTLPASADMPPVEVIKLDGTRVLGDRTLQFAVMRSNGKLAWLRVCVVLADLATAPDVAKNPVAAEFVQVVLELARSAGLAESAAEAMEPVGAKFAAGGRKNGAVGPLRKAIRRVLRSQRHATNDEIWAALAKKPPRIKEGKFEFVGDFGPEAQVLIPGIGWRYADYFRNRAAEERKFLKTQR